MLFELSSFNIELTAFFVLVFAKFTVFDNHVFAALGAPLFIFELSLLIRFMVHEVEHQSLAVGSIKFVENLVLLSDQPFSAFIAVLAGLIVERHFGSVLQFGRSQRECTRFCLERAVQA